MKILIGYDGSENSDFALSDLQRAGLPDSIEALVLTVADVIIPPPLANPEDIFPPETPYGVRLAHEHAERKLKVAELLAQRASDQLRKNFPIWNVQYLATADSPAWALIQKGAEIKADLIVLGAVGHSVLGGRLILGSVSQRVLYEAESSVRIARPSNKQEQTPLRLLVGIDNSNHSNVVVETISSRTWPAGTEVRLVAVVDTVIPVTPDPHEPTEIKWIEVGDPEHWDEVREIFQPLADKLQRRGLDAAVMIVRGNPKEAIVEEAQSWGADCIFVGSKGIRGVERLLLGSVASAVSARAHCSVEVVRQRVK